jgi:hypothetical protein
LPEVVLTSSCKVPFTFNVWTECSVVTVKTIDTREGCYWTYAWPCFKPAGEGSNSWGKALMSDGLSKNMQRTLFSDTTQAEMCGTDSPATMNKLLYLRETSVVLYTDFVAA